MKVSDKLLQKKIGWSPHKGQQEILDSKSRDIVICAGRRFGKTAYCAYRALRTLLADNKRIVIIAPNYDLTQRVFDYLVKWIATAFPDLTPGITTRIPQKIKTPWGTVLECKSAENPVGILGQTYDLVIVDEASRIPRRVWETYVYPTTSEGGNAVFISTPFGKNWFYEKWIEVQKTKGAFHFTSKDRATFKQSEWDRAKEKLPEAVFKQEYQAAFLDDAASVFRRIDEVIGNPLKDVIKGHAYMMGVDLGKHEDFTVITVIDMADNSVAYFDRFNKIEYPFQKERILSVSQRYNNARIYIDSTVVGEPIKEDLERMGAFIDDFKFSNKSKKELVEKLSIFIEQKFLTIPNRPELVDELGAFGYRLTDSGNIIYSAPAGLHDDCVFSLALAVWGLVGKPTKIDYIAEELSKTKRIRRKSYL